MPNSTIDGAPLGPTGSPAWAEPGGDVAVVVPPRLVAVGEAQAAGAASLAACREAGAALAVEGVALEEALSQLRVTSRVSRGADPEYAEVAALSVAWSDTMLGYLHRISCEDPMTGLATQAHLRSRLTEAYRGAAAGATDLRVTHALVVIDLPSGGDSMADVLTLGRIGRRVHTVFAGGETVGTVGPGRIVVLTERDDRLGQRLAVMRALTDRYRTRVWVERLPADDDAAGIVLDELARA